MHYLAFTYSDWEKSLNKSESDGRCRCRDSKRETPEYESDALPSVPTSTSATRSALWERHTANICIAYKAVVLIMCARYHHIWTNEFRLWHLRVPIMTASSTWWMPPCWHSHGVTSVHTPTQIANPIYCVLQQNNFPIIYNRLIYKFSLRYIQRLVPGFASQRTEFSYRTVYIGNMT